MNTKPQVDGVAAAAAIRAVLDRATVADLAAGRDWYRAAGHEATVLSRTNGISREAAAGIIAAISPRLSWGLNVRNARTIAAGQGARGVLGANVAKAERIRAGESPLGVLGGDKVRSFYANICGDLQEVTVDVWALRAAGLPGDTRMTPKVYRTVADAYRTVAAEYGLQPAEAQAAAWVVVRGKAE